MTTTDMTTNSVLTSTDSQAQAVQKAEQVLPMWKIVLVQFFDHKAAVVSLFIILLYCLVALGAPLISMITNLDPDRQNALARYQQPMAKVELSSDEKESVLKTWAQQNPADTENILKELQEKSLITTVGEDGLLELAQKDLDTRQSLLEQVSAPAKKSLSATFKSLYSFHIFGTDELGRDVFIRLIYGTRVSMGVGILVALASALVGLLIGALAGYHGGWIDTALMRITDALLSLPTIPILIVVAAVDLDKVPGARLIINAQNESILKLAVILVVFSWMQVARLVRASILSLREREFILAAKTLGAKDSTIILKHLFPNVIAPLLVSVTLGIGSSILYEAALSFLGLGIQPPTASWGNMLFNAQDLISEAPFLALLPGLQILIVVMSFNYLGDGLQDAIDPKAIRR